LTACDHERSPSAAPERDDPWLFRTYAGHSSAAASNALYRTNLARGQTGLSVAFDLPTQTGYDSDHPLAAGEVGRVGVPICSLADMAVLFDGIPLAQTNTSMTINATAPWLLALYIVVAERQGADPARLAGTVQNDLIKEYLARGTHIFPPRPSLRLIEDVIAFTARAMLKWNPINVCSYHLQEAGATPVQELAYALATAIAVLDQVRAGGQVPRAEFPQVVGRISFFVNAGVRFVTEMCKLRAFVELWDEITAERYGVADPKLRRFRYGVQVNSFGLTEQQPENNVYRILLEALAVVLSKRSRARCNCRHGTRRWACHGRGTSSGACGCSRSWPMRPICSSTTTCSTARPWSRPRSRRWLAKRAVSSPASRRWAGRSPPSRAAT
jgi:(2R)-ethylmalonyl-CoA mutase